MTNNLFPEQMNWTEGTCYYVAGFYGFRMALIAGPYRNRHQAELALSGAQDWAVRSSGDPAAPDYQYAVHEAWNGHSRSILGEWTAPSSDLPKLFDGYEVHGVKEFTDGDSKYCEVVDDTEAEYWSLYGRLLFACLS